METHICGYYKTDHFIYRQWDRSVNDEILKVVLPNVVFSDKQVVVVSRKLLKKYSRNCKCDLLIKICGNTLVTCFYCDFSDYFFNAHKLENYYFIQ